MRTLLAVVAMLFATSLAWAQEAMSAAQFRDLYAQRVTAAVPGATGTPLESLSLRITLPGGGDAQEMTVNLDRAYSEYSAAPDQLDTILDRWVRIASVAPGEAQQPKRIVSVVRTADHVAGYARALSQDGREARLIWRPLAGDLVEMIAFDSPDAIQFGIEETLSEMGLTAEQAWALAPQNLPARLGALSQETLAPGLVWIGGGNGLAPSVLANAQWCAAPENANALYLVVDRDSFLMAERPGAVDFITRVRDGMVSDGSVFSATLLACENGRLQAYAN